MKIYRTKKGYFYKEYKNGKKKRISKEDYLKLKKKNLQKNRKSKYISKKKDIKYKSQKGGDKTYDIPGIPNVKYKTHGSWITSSPDYLEKKGDVYGAIQIEIKDFLKIGVFPNSVIVNNDSKLTGYTKGADALRAEIANLPFSEKTKYQSKENPTTSMLLTSTDSDGEKLYQDTKVYKEIIRQAQELSRVSVNNTAHVHTQLLEATANDFDIIENVFNTLNEPSRELQIQPRRRIQQPRRKLRIQRPRKNAIQFIGHNSSITYNETQAEYTMLDDILANPKISGHDIFTKDSYRLNTEPGTGVISKLFPNKVILGSGSFGVVYRATIQRDIYLPKERITLEKNSHIALKIISYKKQNNREELLKTQNEIDLLDKCDHVNILKLYGALMLKKQCYLYMEYLDGKDLFDYINEFGAHAFNLAQKIDIITQIANGIRYIHSENFIHNDIKLENIILCNNRRIVIIDFGLAVEAAVRRGREYFYRGPPSLGGTSQYAPPEKFRYTDLFSTKVDVWSYGIVVCEVFTRLIPFESSQYLNSNSFWNVATSAGIAIKNKIEQITPYKYQYTILKIIAGALTIDPEKRYDIETIHTLLIQLDGSY